MKASNAQISLLTSIPQLVLASFQVHAAKITDKLKQRKKIVLVSVFLNAIILFLISFLPYITKSITLLIVLYSVYWLFNSFTVPAWSSWMGDLVESSKRGQFFGRRNRVTGFFSLMAHRASTAHWAASRTRPLTLWRWPGRSWPWWIWTRLS